MDKRKSTKEQRTGKGGKIMGTMSTIAVIGGVVAVAATAYYLHQNQSQDTFQRTQNNVSIDHGKILEQAFGEPMHTGKFTLSEATTWLKSHFREGCEGIIFRSDCAALKAYAPNIDLGKGSEHYLIMAMVDKSANTMQDHVLVKFETLDANLNEALGNEGMLVIED